MKKLVASIVLVLSVVVCGPSVHAESLKIAPLIYDDVVLGKGEVKKGFVDISNPEYQKQTVQLQVKAFRQIDDQGSLEFYSNEQVAAGITLDFDKITLDNRGAMRVYFVLNGAKLPQGDVFAAILASTIPSSRGAAAQSVSVGTLLIIQNGTPVSHTAEIMSFDSNWLQIGDGLSARMRVRNPADAKSSTGHYPSIVVAAQPYATMTVKGPLLFAGRTRAVEYREQGSFFGPIYLKASVGTSSKGQLIFAVTGYWRWLAPLLLVFFIVMTIVLRRSLLRRLRKRR